MEAIKMDDRRRTRLQYQISLTGTARSTVTCGEPSRTISVQGAWGFPGGKSSSISSRPLALASALLLFLGHAQGQLSPPRLFFTDLQSGPNTGGEENRGVFISIWGEGFGASRGDSTVTLGGHEVARYVLWGADNAIARDMDTIVIQPGPETTTGDLVVTVAGQPSNPLPFTVRNGQIYFVVQDATNADDSNTGTFDAPFSSIYGARTVMQAGDVVYIRGGQFNQIDPINPGWDAILLLDPENAAVGTESHPVAWVGYPGDPPTLANPEARRGILLATSEPAQSYYMISNMIFSQSLNPVSLAGVGHRVIGNYLHDGAFDDTGAISVDGNCEDYRILGNLLFQNGSPEEKLHHGIYLGGYGANTDIEIGWNQIEDQNGGRAIQLFGHLDGDRIDRVQIHDNLIVGSELNNIVIGGSDGNNDVIGTVEVFNNIIAGAGEPGLRVNDPNGTVPIQNNVLYNNGSSQIFIQRASAGLVTFQNNILHPEGEQTYVEFEPGATSAAFNAQRNLYFNAGPRPDWDTDSLEDNPLFVNVASGDFHLQELSPAIDTGADTGRVWDYEGTIRPQGSIYDIGAFEFSGGVGQPSPTPTDGPSPTASPTSSTSAPTETPTTTNTPDITPTVTPTPIPEDINRDGRVDVLDQLLLLRQWHRGMND
jgi:hypothetical protein